MDTQEAQDSYIELSVPDIFGGESEVSDEPDYESCNEAADCEFDLCVSTPAGKVCTEPCISSCPKGFACKTVTPLSSDPVTICLAKHLSLCFPCNEDKDCTTVPGALSSFEGTRCIPSGGDGGSFCGGSCQEGYDCPQGFNCGNVEIDGQSHKQCVPEGGQCG
ncbi:MAG TPA: hypothetical protein EYN66_13615, partial [Myxococcales bacterium]|nr:hypothetical protein [Myxococcales bacterium]